MVAGLVGANTPQNNPLVVIAAKSLSRKILSLGKKTLQSFFPWGKKLCGAHKVFFPGEKNFVAFFSGVTFVFVAPWIKMVGIIPAMSLFVVATRTKMVSAIPVMSLFCVASRTKMVLTDKNGEFHSRSVILFCCCLTDKNMWQKHECRSNKKWGSFSDIN